LTLQELDECSGALEKQEVILTLIERVASNTSTDARGEAGGAEAGEGVGKPAEPEKSVFV
jgi:hypothetical protein